jgi:hypothetical protein
MTQDETKSETALRLPLQAAPVMRTIVSSAVSGGPDVQASDNNNNPIWDCPS